MTYTVGTPVTGDDLYGREEVIEAVLNGKWTWLCGLRRIGKTSVLKEAEARALRRGWVPLYFDVARVPDDEASAEKVVETFLRVHKRLLHARGVDLTRDPEHDPPERLAAVLEQLTAGGATVLLLWDEAERLIPAERRDPGFLEGLRATLHSSDGLRFAIAATHLLTELYSRRTSVSSFLGTFRWLPIGALSRNDASDLLSCRKRGGTRIEVDTETMGRVLDYAGGHPWVLQEIGATLAARMRGRPVSESGAIWTKTLGDIAANAQVQFIFEDDYQKLTPDQQSILRLLCRDRPIAVDDLCAHIALEPHRLSQALGLLSNFGHVCVNGKVDLRYRFYQDLLPSENGKTQTDPEKVARLSTQTLAATPTRKAFDVFLCHSSSDQDAVRALADELERGEIRVWLDEREIQLFDNIVTKIEEGLRNSSYVMVCLSRNITRSGWCRGEYSAVLDSEFVRGTLRVLPTVVGPCDEDDIPFLLRAKLRADATSATGIAGIVKRLRSLKP